MLFFWFKSDKVQRFLTASTYTAFFPPGGGNFPKNMAPSSRMAGKMSFFCFWIWLFLSQHFDILWVVPLPSKTRAWSEQENGTVPKQNYIFGAEIFPWACSRPLISAARCRKKQKRSAYGSNMRDITRWQDLTQKISKCHSNGRTCLGLTIVSISHTSLAAIVPQPAPSNHQVSGVDIVPFVEGTCWEG